MIDPRYLRELIEATRQVVRIGLALSIYKPKYPKVSTTAIISTKISTKYDVYLQLLFKSKVGTSSKIQPMEAMSNTNTSTIGVKSCVSIEAS